MCSSHNTRIRLKRISFFLVLSNKYVRYVRMYCILALFFFSYYFYYFRASLFIYSSQTLANIFLRNAIRLGPFDI